MVTVLEELGRVLLPVFLGGRAWHNGPSWWGCWLGPTHATLFAPVSSRL